MGNSPYIASADFQIGDVLPRVEIERIEMNDVPTPGKKEKQSMPAWGDDSEFEDDEENGISL